MRVTVKQTLLLAAIRKGNGRGGFADIDQVLFNLDYKTTKQSLQFSLRALIKHGLIEKRDLEPRRGQQRRILSLTKEGYRVAEACCKTGSDES